MIAQTPKAPYYAVIFTSSRTEGDQGYAEAAARMVELAQRQPGFLGTESVRGDDGVGITVSYWTSEAAILAWKNHPEHQAIRERGRSTWYSAFHTRVCKVERDYRFG
ncbi:MULTISPECIES: antibiotic biosynthesis monooxygenase [unclassified Pseudomonas]|uniref:antibiotic biosynthesis monooxygenase family protein n=1 Tax=unclassified Pseudomonas TaxID=196821 RepID=UPI000A1E30FE|nr:MULTISPECIES: antibiotic biosynthesis monooxygenase [unclassified Pseudomonas]